METPLDRKAKYEKEKRGRCVIKVALSSSDDPAEWERIVSGLRERYGSVKNAIRVLAEKDGI